MGPDSCFLLSGDDRGLLTVLGECYNPKNEKRLLELDSCLCYNPKVKSFKEVNKALSPRLIVPLWHHNKTCSAVYYSCRHTKVRRITALTLKSFHSSVMGTIQRTSSGSTRHRHLGEEDSSSVAPENRGGGVTDSFRSQHVE